MDRVAEGTKGGVTMSDRSHYTLADVAARWNCSHSSVLALVYSGDLAAIDISTNPAGRSRYIVPADALDAFEQRRTVAPPAPAPKRRAKVRRSDVIEFFK